MISTATPERFPVPFANNASGAYKRAIPTASRIGVEDGAASLNDGFPPLNFQPTASGGIPPFGEDMNGVLYRVTNWNRWHAAGGPVLYDGTFAAAIGGYPKGATLCSSAFNGTIWFNTAENNTTDPDGGAAAGWVSLIPVTAVRSVTGGGLATGGGVLNANRVITVPKATAAEVLAATRDDVAVTPAGLLLSHFFGTNGWHTLPGGLMVQWGQVRAFVTGEVSRSISFPTAFGNVPYSILMTAYNPSASVNRDTALQVISRTAAGFDVFYQNNGGPGSNNDGFDWFAIGPSA